MKTPTHFMTRFDFGFAALALVALVGCTHDNGTMARIQGTLVIDGSTATDSLAGLPVALLSSAGRMPRAELTLADGTFAFDAVDIGDYVISATVTDSVEVTRTAAINVPLVSSATPIVVPPLSFTGTGSLHGHVVDPLGVAVLGADVAVAGQTLSQLSDANGAFVLTSVPAGTQLVIASAVGRSSGIAPNLQVGWRTDGEVPPIVLSPSTGASAITGIVVWPAAPGPVPPIRVDVDDGQWQGMADASGAFSIPGVPDGVHSLDFYELRVAKSGEPLPLHNRLNRVLLAGGQAFSVGKSVTPLPSIPLFRGRRLAGFGTIGPSNASGFLAYAPEGTTLTAIADGNTKQLDNGAKCQLLVDGAVCTPPMGQVAQYQRPVYSVSVVPFAAAAMPIQISDRALTMQPFDQANRVLLAEPGTTATAVIYRIVDGLTNQSVTMDTEIIAPTLVSIASSSKYFVVIDNTMQAFLFDATTGKLVLHHAVSTAAGAFMGDRFLAASHDGVIALEPNGNVTIINGNDLRQPSEPSPNNAFYLIHSGNWTDYTTNIVRVSDGGVLVELLGQGTPRWSLDGTRVWLNMQHNGGTLGELVEVSLASGAVETIVSGAHYCTGPSAEFPSLWACVDDTAQFVIDAATGQRAIQAATTSGYYNGYNVARPGGIVAYWWNTTTSGRIDWIDGKTLATQALLPRAIVFTDYALPLALADETAHRVAATIDANGELELADRSTSASFYLGGAGNRDLAQQTFLHDGSFLVERAPPKPGLEDLQGLYLTELAR